MGECVICSGDDGFSYTCSYCAQSFCSDHRLPENHQCGFLEETSSAEWFAPKMGQHRVEEHDPYRGVANPPHRKRWTVRRGIMASIVVCVLLLCLLYLL